MKVFIAITAFLFVGCSAIDIGDQSPLSGMDVYEAWLWVDNNIEYKSDFIDDFQLPETTYRLRTGDCEDFCILLMSVMNSQGVEPELVCMTLNGEWHYIVAWKDRYFDAQVFGKWYSNDYIESHFLLIIPYAEAIAMGH